MGQELEGVGLERLRLDVAALRVLLQVHTRALHGGGLLSLRSVSATHARRIALAGLQNVFSVLNAAAEPPLVPAAGARVAGVAAPP